jgi:hypothetical protein
MNDEYGSASLEDIQSFSRAFAAALEAQMGEERAGEIEVEVSSVVSARPVRSTALKARMSCWGRQRGATARELCRRPGLAISRVEDDTMWRPRRTCVEAVHVSTERRRYVQPCGQASEIPSKCCTPLPVRPRLGT